MEDCIFCKIAKKEIPSKIIYEDDDIIAFNDIKPITPVHILVIPKKHISSLFDLEASDELLIGKIYMVIKKLAKENGLDNGFRVIVNCGEDGGQEVKHLHFHILGGKKLGVKICN
jgi:histidine triad (HIT) family protein